MDITAFTTHHTHIHTWFREGFVHIVEVACSCCLAVLFTVAAAPGDTSNICGLWGSAVDWSCCSSSHARQCQVMLAGQLAGVQGKLSMQPFE
jgi:hypothetical protein